MLHNWLYVGEWVWNWQHFVKDPDTGKRIARQNPREVWIVTPAWAWRAAFDAEVWTAA